MNQKSFLKRLWLFLWKEDTPLSWIINIIVAFILVKFIIYPGLGLILETTHPVVAVVSGSMEHNNGFDEWWDDFGQWYEENSIEKEEFMDFDFLNGFNKGDIMILVGVDSEDIEIGDVIVFNGNSRNPIIHRVVDKWDDVDGYHFQTKGDNNMGSSENLGETDIFESEVIGKAKFRIIYFGWFKIWLSSLL